MRSRGTTLAELLVGFGFLGLLSLIIFYSLQGTRTARTVQERNADRTQTLMLSRMRLLDSLRAARIITPNSEQSVGSVVEFQQPRLENGFMLVDVVGQPIWGQVQRIFLDDDGKLQLEQPGGELQILGRLGELGGFQAKRAAPYLLLEITVRRKESEAPRSLEFQIYAPLEVVLAEPGSEV